MNKKSTVMLCLVILFTVLLSKDFIFSALLILYVILCVSVSAVYGMESKKITGTSAVIGILSQFVPGAVISWYLYGKGEFPLTLTAAFFTLAIFARNLYRIWKGGRPG